MIDWGTLSTYILSGVLKDPAGTQADPDQMIIWARWACTEISQHTAEAVSKTVFCDGTTNKFALPDDVIDGISRSGMIIYNDNTRLNNLPNIQPSPDSLWPINPSDPTLGWMEWPSGQLTLSFNPPSGTTFQLNYFRIWEPPIDDNSILMFPKWMEHPFAYLVGAYAQDPQAVQASSIRQWNRKQDSGNPLDNPLQQQSVFFIKQAYRLLGLQTPQDRDNYYGQKPRVGGWR